MPHYFNHSNGLCGDLDGRGAWILVVVEILMVVEILIVVEILMAVEILMVVEIYLVVVEIYLVEVMKQWSHILHNMILAEKQVN